MLRRLSLRARVAAVLAVLLVVSAGPAWAYWKAQQSVPSQRFDVGTLDLKVNGQDATVAVAGMTATNMVPGSTLAGALLVRNNGTIPLSYYATISGGNADGKGLAANLTVAASRGGSVTGSGLGSTCSGGTALPGASMSSGQLAYGSAVGDRQPLAAGATETLCVQMTLSASAPSSVQGGTSTITMTATGEQVGQP